MKRQTIPLIALVASMALATQSSADPEGYPSGRPFQAIEQDFETVLDAIGDIQVDIDAIEEDIDAIKSDVTTIKNDVSTVKGDVTSIKSEVEALSDVLTVEVVVNTAVCSSLAAQCNGFGNVDPVEGNDSPIQLVASVSRGGVPVTGLDFEDFAFISGTVAPGGADTIFCEALCNPSFFAEAGLGIYQMFLKPIPAQTWDDGAYTGSIAATDPAGGSGVALTSFSIPSAP